MKIIPVLDLKTGQVVHAVRGLRDQYQPIDRISRITASSVPVQVVRDFLQLYPFEHFYIADLDAICQQGNHQRVIEQLLDQFPDIEFWIDNGSQLAQIQETHARRKMVIGTESQQSPPHPIEFDYVLSLDFNQQALGNPDWFNQPQYWPSTIILMTLSRVGSNNGPDWQKLGEFSTRHPDKQLIAAGGIRNYQDLKQLTEMRLSGVLLATALHSGAISGQQISELQAKKYPGKPGYS